MSENWRDGDRAAQGASRGGGGYGNRPRRDDNQENGGGRGYGNRGPPRRQYDDNQDGGGGRPRRQYDDNQEYGRGGGGGGGGGYGGGRPRRDYDDQSGESKVIMVPAHKVGKIIGRGGSKIQELQSESGARIKVGNSNGEETDVTLRGSEDSINKAESMINDLVVSEYSGDRQGGDQYNRQY